MYRASYIAFSFLAVFGGTVVFFKARIRVYNRKRGVFVLLCSENGLFGL